MFEVRVTQLIPFTEPDADDEEWEAVFSAGRTETYVAGTFQSEQMAKIFAEALEQQIAESQNFVANIYTPQISIWKVTEVVTEEPIKK